MDWANERYVRLFVRDTTTWKLLPWQSKALLPLILRKLDRSGVIDLGDDGESGLAAVIEMPPEFVAEGLPALLKREVFKMRGGKFVMPNFLAAQEAKQSDAQRKRESRENQRAAALRSQVVTDGHTVSGSQPVTDCPVQSHEVTPDQTSPDPNPDQTYPDPSARARSNPPANEPGKPTAYHVVSLFLGIRAEVLGAGGKSIFAQPANGDVEKCAQWLSSMQVEDCQDIEPAIRLACKHVSAGDQGWTHPDMAKTCFLFGAIVRSWPDLREELHGCAPVRLVPKPKHEESARRSTPVKEW